ncbi:hypothetical protein ACFYRG_00030 [Streptomyces mirabilis]|uniref:hypothetical protein n=1 Tax=Streptomyces mirabilis TaxID=68239 RepID=UPI00369DA578
MRSVEGDLVNAYPLRNGTRIPEEKALRFPNSSQASHTESRAGRMSGAAPSVRISGDRYANLAPVSPGGTVTIAGTNPPCTQCQGSMRRAAAQTGAAFVYVWGGKTWSSAG